MKEKVRIVIHHGSGNTTVVEVDADPKDVIQVSVDNNTYVFGRTAQGWLEIP